jgi:hypothetical protein
MAVQADKSVDAKIHIKVSDCSIVNTVLARVVEPGDFHVLVGKAANDIKSVLLFSIPTVK